MNYRLEPTIFRVLSLQERIISTLRGSPVSTDIELARNPLSIVLLPLTISQYNIDQNYP